MPRICLAHGLYAKGAPCPDCVREKDRARGSSSERGIGPVHRHFAQMIKMHEPSCALCGQPYGDPDNPITVGHKTPRAAFRHPLDADTWDNLQPECRRCNFRKSNDR